VELAPFFTSGNLMPLERPADVAWGTSALETLCRLTELVVVILRKSVDRALSILLPHQLGVAVKNAALLIARACGKASSRLRRPEGFRILQVDLKNAFNSVIRETIFQQVLTHVPVLYPWAHWSLASHSSLFCRDMVLRRENGVHQGSPLGPLLVSRALQGDCRGWPGAEERNLRSDDAVSR